MTAGRPLKYKKEYGEKAYKLALLGATCDEMADILGIARSTFFKWMKDHKDFSDYIKRGKDLADSEVAYSLNRRARGYTCKETKVFCQDGEIIEHTIDKHYPPDTGAAMAWLKTRQPKRWPNKVEYEVTHNEGKVSDKASELINRLKDT